MNHITIRKLDRRNRGHEYFKYMVKSSVSCTIWSNRAEFQIYYQMREWCWNTWGPSKELTDYIADQSRPDKHTIVYSQNEHWCWQNDEYYRRIYLTGDKELIMFKLKWN